MPRIVIDNQAIDVPAGSTLLEAARRLGLDVPALCWHQDCRPKTACMVCLMKVSAADRSESAPRLVPSCATIVEDGMKIESETEEVWQVRRATLELLLSDHAGECRAPCQYACPFDTDIPRMIRQVAAGSIVEAIVTLRKSMPLAAVLARVSPDTCEGACRRRMVDESVAIGLLKRYVADKNPSQYCAQDCAQDYAQDCGTGVSPVSHHGPEARHTSKRIAIVGAGPAGLSAAYFLLQQGHACTLFDAHDMAGGTLLSIPEERLPRDVLDAEITIIEKLGARFELNMLIGRGGSGKGPHGTHTIRCTLDELRRDHDAVLIATGKLEKTDAEALGLVATEDQLQVDGTTHETEMPSVFAAGDAVRPRGKIVRAAVDGKAAACCIDQYLQGIHITGPAKLPALRLGRPKSEELAAMAAEVAAAPPVSLAKVEGNAGPVDEEAQVEARRCLHCDCHKLDKCRLRKYAEMYGADAGRYRGRRRPYERCLQHPDVIYEPGKCILCGLCIEVAEQAGEQLGLTFVGRGFDVRVAAPFEASLAEALKIAAPRCAEVCPTGALVLRSVQLYGACRHPVEHTHEIRHSCDHPDSGCDSHRPPENSEKAS